MKLMFDMILNKQQQVRSGWLIIMTFALMMFAQVIATIPGIIMSFDFDGSLTDGGLSLDTDLTSGGNIFYLQGIPMLVSFIVVLIIWKFFHKQSLNALGFKGPVRDLFFGLFFGAASITVIFFMLYFTGNLTVEESLFSPTFSWMIAGYFVIFIVGSLFEETFFRGYIITIMQSRKNHQWLIYLVSSLFFSIVHGVNPNVTLLGLINIFIVGILFAYMFIKTKSLLLPLGYHITWNFFQGNVFSFEVSALKTPAMYNVDLTTSNTLLTGGDFGLEGSLLATILILFGFIITRLYCSLTKRKPIQI